MTDFTLHCRTDPDVRDLAGYAATYGIRVSGDEAYQGHLFRRQGLVQQSRFESLAAGYRPFEIHQTNWVGIRKIDVREAFAGERIGEIRGLKLYFDGPNQIVGLHDPTPMLQRLARNVLKGSPDRFVFRRAVDRAGIGWMEIPRTGSGVWPVRLIRNLKRSRVDQEAPVWQGQLSWLDLDFRPCLAAAVILHCDWGRPGG